MANEPFVSPSGRPQPGLLLRDSTVLGPEAGGVAGMDHFHRWAHRMQRLVGEGSRAASSWGRGDEGVRFALAHRTPIMSSAFNRTQGMAHPPVALPPAHAPIGTPFGMAIE